tara:strand:- start:16 stop:261 length:246 start_codon:yes stop_codon:yes gene_type:complete
MSFIYFLALLSIFAIGVLISPIWELGLNKKKINTTIYDRQNPAHLHLFKGYPRYKGRYIEVPISRMAKDKFWKEFRKKYFK